MAKESKLLSQDTSKVVNKPHNSIKITIHENNYLATWNSKESKGEGKN